MVAFFVVTGVERLQQPFQGYPQARTGGRELYMKRAPDVTFGRGRVLDDRPSRHPGIGLE
jgi:hypothetical protein